MTPKCPDCGRDQEDCSCRDTQNQPIPEELAENWKKDAERYRWLIENSFDREGVPQMHIRLHTWEPHSKTGELTEWAQRVRGNAIDRVIDSAMLAAAPEVKQ